MYTNRPTSIKELFQSMTPINMEIIQGIVTSVSPLEITAVNDNKLILNENTVIVPWYLTDYTTKCDIELRDGEIKSHTYKDGEHPHGTSGEHPHGASGTHGGHLGGEGVHSHPSSEGSHSHPSSEGAHINWLEDFNIYRATIRHYNALKVGEVVYILSFNHGKRYFVLDRECDYYEW